MKNSCFYLKEFNGALQSSQKHRKHQIKNIPKEF